MAAFQQLTEFFPFLVRKARVCSVCFRVFQVNFVVGHIKVTAQDNRLCLCQFQHICTQFVLKIHTVVNSCQTFLAVWRIGSDKPEFFVFQCNQSAFIIHIIIHTCGNRQWFVLCKNGCAGITFFHSAVPVLFIARQVQGNLVRLQFCFLQAEKVCIFSIEKIHKAFAHTGAQAVYVPRNKFHNYLLKKDILLIIQYKPCFFQHCRP